MSADDLYAVLRVAIASRDSTAADAFLTRFAHIEDYDEFCTFMGEWSTLSMYQRMHVNKDNARRDIEKLGRVEGLTPWHFG